MSNNKLPYLVADVKTRKRIRFKEKDIEDIKKGSTVTISELDHPKDVKLWSGRGIFQISPKYFDINNPVRIIRKHDRV